MSTLHFCEPLWKTDGIFIFFTLLSILCSSSCLKGRHGVGAPAILKHEGKGYTQGRQSNEGEGMWVPGSSVEKSHYTSPDSFPFSGCEPGFEKGWYSAVKLDVPTVTHSHHTWDCPLISPTRLSATPPQSHSATSGLWPTAEVGLQMEASSTNPMASRKFALILKLLTFLAPTCFVNIHVNKPHLDRNGHPSTSLVCARGTG